MNNVEVFKTTLNYIKSSNDLKKSIDISRRNTKLYKVGERDGMQFPPRNGAEDHGVDAVYNEKAFTAARQFIGEGRIAVLNMANPFNPGGGVLIGAQAQEEDLCRCSTLYPVISTPYCREVYYKANKVQYKSTDSLFMDELYSGNVLYSRGIRVFRSDIDYSFLEEPFDVDIITAAAPIDEYWTFDVPHTAMNHVKLLKEPPIMDPKNINRWASRLDTILYSAYDNGAEILVLGAIGCGAFGNLQDLVARAFRFVIAGYGFVFKKIVFAVYDENGSMSTFVENLEESW